MSFLIITQLTDSLNTLSQNQPFLVYDIFKDILFALVALAGVVIAALGLRTWRKQLRGNTEYELARRVLKAIYFTRDQIKNVRDSFMWSGEIANAMKENGYENDPFDPNYFVNSTRAVYSIRMNKLNEAISNLRIELLEAEVIWGNVVEVIFKDFYDCIGELNYAVYQHLRSLEGHSKLDDDEYKKKEDTIYSTRDDSEKNEFSGKLKSSVEGIEKFIRPKLKI